MSTCAHRVFRLVYAGLTLNFILPAISYMAAPELTIATLDIRFALCLSSQGAVQARGRGGRRGAKPGNTMSANS